MICQQKYSHVQGITTDPSSNRGHLPNATRNLGWTLPIPPVCLCLQPMSTGVYKGKHIAHNMFEMNVWIDLTKINDAMWCSGCGARLLTQKTQVRSQLLQMEFQWRRNVRGLCAVQCQ